jgi:hypothetical protein
MSISTWVGKSVTIDHPADRLVNSQNWREFNVGTIIDARRGGDDLRDFLVADMMIYDAGVIDMIASRTRHEVSIGHTVVFEKLGAMDCETAIVGNHVAIVGRGLCGSGCAISGTAGDVVSLEKGNQVMDKSALTGIRWHRRPARDEKLDDTPISGGVKKLVQYLPRSPASYTVEGDGETGAALYEWSTPQGGTGYNPPGAEGDQPEYNPGTNTYGRRDAVETIIDRMNRWSQPADGRTRAAPQRYAADRAAATSRLRERNNRNRQRHGFAPSDPQVA